MAGSPGSVQNPPNQGLTDATHHVNQRIDGCNSPHEPAGWNPGVLMSMYRRTVPQLQKEKKNHLSFVSLFCLNPEWAGQCPSTVKADLAYSVPRHLCHAPLKTPIETLPETILLDQLPRNLLVQSSLHLKLPILQSYQTDGWLAIFTKFSKKQK